MRVFRALAAMAVVIPAFAQLMAGPSEPPPGPTQELSAPVFEVDYERSVLVAKLEKAGLLRFLGHEHGVIPGAWSAEVRYDPENLAASRIAVEVRTSALVIDTEEARRLAGVDPKGPTRWLPDPSGRPGRRDSSLCLDPVANGYRLVVFVQLRGPDPIAVVGRHPDFVR